MFKAEDWKQTVDYFRRRGGVVFVSYCRFWEKHGFVQQSLAQRLAKEGVPVTWLDGAGWRPYQPVIPEPLPHLKVAQLPALPLRRLSLVSKWDRRTKSAYLKKILRRKGNPVVWVQAGMDEEVARELPYVDIFSVFDD